MVRLAARTRSLLPIAAILLLALPAFARSQASLGDLQIPASRVPLWHPADDLPLDTSGWTNVDVPCNGGDPSAITSALNSAPDNSVVWLPENCRYVIPGSLVIQRSNVVLKGRSRQTSILEFQHLDRDMLLVYIPSYPSNEPFGGGRSWTAGFQTGTDVLTVAYTDGLELDGWVRMKANPEPDWHQNARNIYVAKVACIGRNAMPGVTGCGSLSNNQIKLDRPLPAPFDQGGQVVEQITGPYLKHVGIETLRLQHANPSRVEKYHAFVEMEDCHECWITDSTFGDAGNSHIGTKDVVRTVFRGNDFGSNQCTSDGATCLWNKGAIYLNQGDADVVFENNTLTESPSGPLAQGGAGAVIAYNYMRSSSAVECERHVFLHGQGVTATLAEGNDVDCMMQWDSYRDGQGYNNTFYRNRLRGADTRQGGYQRGRLGGEDTGSHIHRFITVIGNHVNELMGSPQMTGRAIDNSSDATHRHEDTWVSYNVVRREMLFEDSGAQVRTTQHENYVRNDPPSSWQGTNFPASLYRGNQAPSWWCQESGPFPSIGAMSDREGSYTKLPAQIRLEGGTCTPPDGGPPPPPAEPLPAPVILTD
jgi:hypothetical protein